MTKKAYRLIAEGVASDNHGSVKSLAKAVLEYEDAAALLRGTTVKVARYFGHDYERVRRGDQFHLAEAS